MPNGGEHYERLGVCPRCGSHGIRIRRQRHRHLLWRCRRCNGVFRTPRVADYIIPPGDDASGYVLAESIPQMERRGRLHERRGGRHLRRRSLSLKLTVVAVIVLLLGAAGYWIFMAGLGRTGGGPDQHPGSDESLVITGLQSPTPEPVSMAVDAPTPSLQATAMVAQVGIATAIPTDTPAATPTMIPPSTPAPALVLAKTPTPEPSETPTLLSVPTPVPPSPTPTPTPVVSPDLQHILEKRYMLELINAERTKASVQPVVLGDNVSAQLHAESSLDNCVASHWGIGGLKPYMRYSLAGGYQANGENGHGSDYCIKASDRYRPIVSIEQKIRDAMNGWMNGPGHRHNILGKWHKKVNIGLAWGPIQLQSRPALRRGLRKV